jgi:putative phosphonate metabolism protein
MSRESGRYAIYFAPEPGSPLARFGASWLGYDVAGGEKVPQPAVPTIDAEWLRAITAEPRRYGFHATLKPPFILAEGCMVEELEEATAALAHEQAAFDAPPLHLSCISGFWALTLSMACAPLHALADRCVRDLDRFRAPASAEELARRRRARLTARQEQLLARWGYPHVMDEFRFHMTLTARLDAAEGAVVARALEPLVAPLCRESPRIDALSLFHQPNHDAPFRLVQRYPLGSRVLFLDKLP